MLTYFDHCLSEFNCTGSSKSPVVTHYGVVCSSLNNPQSQKITFLYEKCFHMIEFEEMTNEKRFRTSRAFFFMTSISAVVSVENYRKKKSSESL